ncbi:hypothetical protein J1N35_034568 [Gossypium stocksii]|uniref:Uncharacterized protein n=1 Tax=Gossypium stocksii TaxID=47602 RepID=A0A9D3USD5_9ROSI|nr:hypothetical protein J1N35_034568 [Gossypium stocksii]
MSLKVWTTRILTERPYEASLFPRIGFGLFLCSLGGRRRRPPSRGPEPSMRYHFRRARILTLCQDLRANGQSQDAPGNKSNGDEVELIAQRIRARGYKP